MGKTNSKSIEDRIKSDDMKVVETIVITIDDEMVKEYNRLYFEEYPRRRKAPIDRCTPPSLNQWINMNKNQYSNEKQKWDSFGEWVVRQHGLANKRIERCRMSWDYYFPTRHRRDLSNFLSKSLEDALVSSGLLIDDNMNVVNPVMSYGYYDKEHPRTEIVIEVLEEATVE